MCHPAAPIEMNFRPMLCQSVRRVPLASGSSSHRMSFSPQLYSSNRGASARLTLVSETCGVGVPTVRASQVRRCRGSDRHRTAPTRAGVLVRSGLARPSAVDDAVLERERVSTCPRPFGPQRQQRRPVRTAHGWSSFLSFPGTHQLRAIEVTFERVDVGRPEVPEGSKPGVDVHERFRSDPVDAPLRVHSRLYKAGLPEHPEVLGDRGLWHPKLVLDLADGPLRGRKEAQDGPTIWFRDDAEGRFHDTYIPDRLYACQAMHAAITSVRGGVSLHLPAPGAETRSRGAHTTQAACRSSGRQRGRRPPPRHAPPLPF